MLDSLIEQSRQFDTHKHDEGVRARDLVITDAGQVILPSSAPLSLSITDSALVQICAKLGPTVSMNSIPAEFMRNLPNDEMAWVLNRRLQAATDSMWLARSYEASLRAMLDGSYPGQSDANGNYENTRYLQVVESLLEAGDYKDVEFVRPSVTADELYLKVAMKPFIGGDGNFYKIGALIRNSEIGHGFLVCAPFVQRTSCANSTVWNKDNKWRFVHRVAGGFAALMVQFKERIGSALHAAADVLDDLIAAERDNLADFNAIIDGLAIQRKWSFELKQNVIDGTEGKRSRAGLVHGVTYAAHKVYGDSPEKLVEMETYGGDLLYAKASVFEGAINAAKKAHNASLN
jgi:hypothetical protein